MSALLVPPSLLQVHHGQVGKSLTQTPKPLDGLSYSVSSVSGLDQQWRAVKPDAHLRAICRFQRTIVPRRLFDFGSMQGEDRTNYGAEPTRKDLRMKTLISNRL